MMSYGCTGYCYCNTVLYGVAMGCSDSAREVLQDFTDQNLHMCRRLLNKTVGTKKPITTAIQYTIRIPSRAYTYFSKNRRLIETKEHNQKYDAVPSWQANTKDHRNHITMKADTS